MPQPIIYVHERGRRALISAAWDRIVSALRPRPSVALEGNGAHVRIFGSAARGDDHPGSDLDVLVDVGPTVTLFDIVDMEDELERLLGVPVDAVHDFGASPALAAARAEAGPL